MATIKQNTPNAHTRILGIGAYRPSEIVTNDDVCQWIESSDEWIVKRTGIHTRHRAPAGVSVAQMAEHAAREAMEAAGITGEQLDTVIVSSVSFPYLTPSLAARLADALGATPAAAYDISAACAGYCYGIAQADALVRSGDSQYVLVIGAEKLSDVIDNSERSISFLLGDGAGAVVIGPSDVPGISPSVWGSDGSKWDAIRMTHPLTDIRTVERGGQRTFSRDLVDPETGEMPEDATLWPTLRQDGQTVFRWATWEGARVAKEALEASGLEPEDLAAFVPHQANMRIIDQMAKVLKLPESVIVARDIAEAGNTSAASIPLATHRLLAEHPELSGKPSLQIGFGAGLVYGAQVVLLP
ncbi:beta-ketoacyl-[acyl-carrier-protein] synthase III [Kocuria varians]|uniref:Beta-ketoacyl-[acyl-carrier-protein] synthase III n=1 Tax=Kocuria varians TaxID=1272 RepID=A0A4Y4D924_KOCVA|nr:beta-ketoacyl-ACP synthase III [Kocuria varians]GEC99260.1 beta-ketoacyl-[acyl-carrier-protein] synthase III [Kocuria varians]